MCGVRVICVACESVMCDVLEECDVCVVRCVLCIIDVFDV